MGLKIEPKDLDLFALVPGSMVGWRDCGIKCGLYGKSASDMTRDELLALIGYMSQERKGLAKRHKESLDFLGEIAAIAKRGGDAGNAKPT